MKKPPLQDRRSFLKAMGGSTAMAAALPVLFNQQQAAAAPPDAAGANHPGYSAGRFALEIDNTFAGWLLGAEGGHAVGEVITELFGPGKFMRKQVSGYTFEDILISFDTLSPALLNVVQRTLNLEKTRVEGAIVTVDENSKVLSRLMFYGALITEINFPALDAASGDAVKMTVKLAPEFVQRMPGSGSLASPPPAITAQRRWLASNFRLAIDGLDCSSVSRVEALTVRQIPYPGPGGGPGPGPTAVEFPDVVLTLSEYSAPKFYKWHEDYVINGGNGNAYEKAGTLSWLDLNGKELGSLSLKGLGVFKVAPVKPEPGTGAVRLVEVEMYCEEINVKPGGVPVPR
ncbi:MAG TPA: hypothetical protein VG796_17970 [Verrucomicrobiales bacterium]|nr:hypothetical protein [Verrucomicrobiales bacterium]